MLIGQHIESELKIGDFQRRTPEQFSILSGFQKLFPSLFPGITLAGSEFH
jgi:hypothetical protein